jgi:hypothetical protein
MRMTDQTLEQSLLRRGPYDKKILTIRRFSRYFNFDLIISIPVIRLNILQLK